MNSPRQVGRLSTFLTIWVGQLVSVSGSSLTQFAIGVWLFQTTGSATSYALAAFFATVPDLLISPLAGTLVDRWNRRWVMIGADVGAALCTLILALLLFGDRLQVWQLFACIATMSIFGAFQTPAYTAAVTLLVPKEKLGRANGLMELGQAAPQLLAPIMAGFLIASIQVRGILIIDLATFLVAVVTLISVRIPRPQTSTETQSEKGSLLTEARQGWVFITSREGLMGLLVFAAAFNFFLGMAMVSLVPLVLSFATPATLGIVMTLTGVGMLAGSVLLSVWGGPKRKTNGILIFALLAGCCLALFSLPPKAWIIATAGSMLFFCAPIIRGCSQVIWQRKVPADLQGRVLAMRRMLSMSTTPLAYLVAGPLIDRVFSPLMAEGGSLADSLGRLIGTGPGRGAGLLFLVAGVSMILVALATALSPRVRRLEDELPDAVNTVPSEMQ